MILDAQVPTADPEQLIYCFERWVKKIANWYIGILERKTAVDIDDLFQVGRIALLSAQKNYDPGKGSFLNYSKWYIQSAIRKELGFTSDGQLPYDPISLDVPLTEDSDETLLDFIPDTTPTAEERIVEEDGCQETAVAVRSAVDRLKSDRERDAIQRIYFDGQGRETAAAEMGITRQRLSSLEHTAYIRMQHDKQLRQYAMLQYPFMRVGAGRFRSTWTSATEKAVLWRERRYDDLFGDGAFLAAGRHDPEDVQTSIGM